MDSRLPLVPAKADTYAIKSESITDKQKIGEGSWAYIYKCLMGDKVVALKSIATYSRGKNIATKEICLAEIEILKKVTDTKAPNTVQLFGYFESLTSYGGLEYNIVMTYAGNGSLDAVLKNPAKFQLSLKQCEAIMLGACKAVEHLHSLNIIHCDLKADNFLLTAAFKPLLADFGLSKREEDDYPFEVGGSDKYFAPEIWLGFCGNTRGTDIFALGLVLWEIVSRPAVLYSSMQYDTDIISWYQRGKRPLIPTDPDKCPPYVANMMRLAWNEDPSKRPAAKIMVEAFEKQIPFVK